MNCERVEGYLSAFLDNALDPRLSQEIRAHVEGCERCRAILDDYRSFDHLLASLPRVEPPDALRPRVFGSEEYRQILRERDERDERAARGEPNDGPNGAPDEWDPADAPDLAQLVGDVDLGDVDLPDPDAHPEAPELDFPELADPTIGDAPAAGPMAFAPTGAEPRSASRPWPKLLPVAAALTLTLGAALLFRQGLFPSGATTDAGRTTTIGNPGQTGAPLSAGPRLVYPHDGILWSAPENGPGLAQPLTPTNITVGGWAVAPLAGDSGARLVAYIDARTGAVHVIRSDGQSDRTLDATASGTAGGLSWSPDGARLAYLAPDGTLHLMNADGTANQAISGAGAHASPAAWSADAQWIAYAETRDGVASVWSRSLVDGATRELAAQADPDDARAIVAQLFWLPDALHPGVTWATGTGGTVTGIYERQVLGNGATRRLTPAGAGYAAAAYTAGGAGGEWLVADGARLSLISADTGKLTAVGAAAAPVTRVVWSPAGMASGMAAVVAGDKLALWSAASGLVPVDAGVAGVAPAWSADGQGLLYATSAGARLASLADGRTGTPATVLPTMSVSALGWAPDGRSVAIVTSTGVLLSSPDGAHAKLVDHRGADGGQMAWSVAK